MCGICGIVGIGEVPIREEDVARMCDALAHRGPDDAGLQALPSAVLGARRLSVMDPSERGHMPMSSEDGSLWLVHNGEVYNYRELRDELEAQGHRFRSDGDTEVVLHAYQEWGPDCVRRLEGMFAFALWDVRRERLFCARDRLGVKPFFFARRGRCVVFASEVHALYPLLETGPEAIDPGALDAYLALGYVPPDRAFVRGVEKLAPAHTLTVDAAGVRLERYWELRFRPTRAISVPDALDAVEEALEGAVRRRLRSDVPLGCFLSGGIDSGLVAALAARAGGEPLHTFSVGFAGADAEDERPLARLVAGRYGTRHRELEVDPERREQLPRALWHVGEPFADVGLLSMAGISHAAREHITVALSGDGGDESFAGYPNVLAARRAERFRRSVPALLRRGIGSAAGLLSGPLPQAARAQRWLEGYVERQPAGQLDAANHWSARWRAALYRPEAAARAAEAGAERLFATLLADAGELCDAEQHMLADLRLRLPGDFLTKVDIGSNLASLEVRSPFLDHRVVELAAGLPLELKLLGGRQKGLLRRLAERHLPAELVAAPKRGFAPHVGDWMRGPWAPMARELCREPATVRAGLFDGVVVTRVSDEHLRGAVDHSERLWSFLCLEIWWRLFVDRSLSPGDAL